MKKAFLPMLVITVLLMSMNVFSEKLFTAFEREVDFQNFGQTVKGILTVPAEKSALSPAVMIFHGFTGQKNEMDVAGTQEAMFEMTSRILAENGIISLRIDFRGSGESDGNWEDTTFNGQISDAIAGIDYLCALPFVDSSRIGVLGLSQGGLVAACTASRDDRVKSAVLWSPVAVPAYTYSSLLGAQTVAEAIKEDKVLSAALPWGATTELKSEFFRELFTVDPIAEIAGYKGPLFVAVGTNDDIVTPQPMSGRLFLKYHDGLEKISELEADHMMNIFVSDETLLGLVGETIEWFEDTF